MKMARDDVCKTTEASWNDFSMKEATRVINDK